MKNPLLICWCGLLLLASALPAFPDCDSPITAFPIAVTALTGASLRNIDRIDQALLTELPQLKSQGYTISGFADGLPTVSYATGNSFTTFLPVARTDSIGRGLTGYLTGLGFAVGDVDSVLTGVSAKDGNGNAYFTGYGDTPTQFSQAFNSFGRFQATPANGVGSFGWSGTLNNLSSIFPGGTTDSVISAISLNALTMVGYSLSDESPDPFYWTLPGGTPYVPLVPPGVFSGKATAVNALGTLGVIDYSDPFGGSATSGSIGFIYYNNSSLLPLNLGKYPGSVATHSYGLSGDGSTVSGWYTDSLSRTHPMIWKGSFLDLGGGTKLGQAYASTTDGSEVVGYSGANAFAWTAATGIQPLQSLNGATSSTATCISADGVLIGGMSNGPGFNSGGVAQLWTGDGTPINLQTLLMMAGQNTTGWSYNQVTACVHNSDNSYFCGGYGLHNGAREGFLVEIDVSTAPRISFQPANQAVSAGSTAVFSVGAEGGTSYQWLKNGTAIPGATSSTLTLSGVPASAAGVYAVEVTNSGGTTQSANASLTVNAAGTGPAFTSQPVAQTIVSGTTLVFNATASGSATTYQWQLNGLNIAGATSSRLVLSNATGTNVGNYVCVATSGGVSTTSNPASFRLANSTNVGRLINLSVNTTAGKSQVLTVGFVSGGTGTTGSENLLVRATGPALAGLGVSNTLADPTLTVLNGQTVVASNDNWGSPTANQTAVTAADTATFAFPLSNPAGLDAAVAMPFAAGADTVQISGNTAASGVTLAEIYDNTPTASYTLATPRLINLSAKNQLASSGSMTAGFVVGGSTSKTVLIRATGPALALLGVTGTLPDPQLALHSTVNGQDTVLATNAGWGGDPQITAASNAVFAFPLTNPASKDSVVLLTLAPGSYTAIASSASGVAGTVLIEVYEIP